MSRVKGGGLSRTFIHLGNLFPHHISHSASEVHPQFKTSAWLVLSFLQPFDSKEQQHLIFPYNIISESHVKVTRIKESSRLFNNSPCQHLRKSMEKSIENMHTDVRVKGVDSKITISIVFICNLHHLFLSVLYN